MSTNDNNSALDTVGTLANIVCGCAIFLTIIAMIADNTTAFGWCGAIALVSGAIYVYCAKKLGHAL